MPITLLFNGKVIIILIIGLHITTLCFSVAIITMFMGMPFGYMLIELL